MHVPPSSHSSRLVSTLPSSHGAQGGRCVCEHPTAGLHVSVVQGLPSLQSPPVRTHTNATHTSVVHALSSAQSALRRQNTFCAGAARAAQSSSPLSRISCAARAADERSRGRLRSAQPPLAALPIVGFIFA